MEIHKVSLGMPRDPYTLAIAEESRRNPNLTVRSPKTSQDTLEIPRILNGPLGIPRESLGILRIGESLVLENP